MYCILLTKVKNNKRDINKPGLPLLSKSQNKEPHFFKFCSTLSLPYHFS